MQTIQSNNLNIVLKHISKSSSKAINWESRERLRELESRVGETEGESTERSRERASRERDGEWWRDRERDGERDGERDRESREVNLALDWQHKDEDDERSGELCRFSLVLDEAYCSSAGLVGARWGLVGARQVSSELGRPPWSFAELVGARRDFLKLCGPRRVRGGLVGGRRMSSVESQLYLPLSI